MNSPTYYTAPVRHVQAKNGTKFAYRVIRPPTSSTTTPLLMHIFHRGCMDFWDPALITPLTRRRTVILFDQAGVGASSGSVPTTFRGWADDVKSFCNCLDLSRIDLLGFSMGGCAAQMVALTYPNLVRRLILCGTGPSEPDPHLSDLHGIVWPRERPPQPPIRHLASAVQDDPQQIFHALQQSFFPSIPQGQAACDAYWKRIVEQYRQNHSVAATPTFLSHPPSKRQRSAYAHWSKPNPENSFDRLHELRMPVLVMNGADDLLIPTSQSWELARRIEDAKLVLYPSTGHGFLFQLPDQVAEEINKFLDDKLNAKL